MAENAPHVTEAELAILHVLWDSGPSTARHLTDLLYPGGSFSHYATVKKLLERLEAKGCVRRDRSQPAHVFEASIARDDLIGHRLREVAESLCEGSLTPLLTHLARTQKLTKEERETLRSLVEGLDRPEQKKRRPRGS